MSIPAQGAEGAETMTIDHEFKSAPSVFYPAARGEKMFEYRRDDRGGYHVGQTVRLRCYDAGSAMYLPEPPLDRRITNILRGGEFELPMGYCILSLSPLASPRADSDERTAGEDGTRALLNLTDSMWRDAERQVSLLERHLRRSVAWRPVSEAPGDGTAAWIRYKDGTGITVAYLNPEFVETELPRLADAWAHVTPAQPAGAVPDSLRALSEAVREYGKAEWSAGYATGSYGEGPNPDVTDRLSNVLNSLSLLLASHPAGQSAGPALCSYVECAALGKSSCEDCRDTPRRAGQSAGTGVARTVEFMCEGQVCTAEVSTPRPAPDSTRTGQGEAEERLIGPKMTPEQEARIAHNLCGEFGPDAVIANASFVKAFYAELYAAARPAVPEAQGASPTLPMSYHLMCEEERRLHTVMEVAATWHDDQAKALSKQPPGGARDWQRLEHEEQARLLREDRIAPPASSGQGGR